MEVIRIAVLGIAGVFFAITLKYYKPEYSVFVSLAVCIIIFALFISRIKVMIEYVSEIGEMISVDKEYIQAILKMMGIAYVSEFASNICKDAGYQAIASQIEIFSKIAILIMSLPVLFTFIETIGEFL